MIVENQTVSSSSDYTVKHPDYYMLVKDWERIRDCIRGETVIKSKSETYLPRPPGMTGIYADAYDTYLERAHFPQICAYALQGALGVIVTKLPDFNVPSQLRYIIEETTKDGNNIQQFFLDCVIEVLQTGRCIVVLDVTDDHKFKLVKYRAENFINWKESTSRNKKNIVLAVLKEAMPSSSDMLSHDTEDVHFVSYINEGGKYAVKAFADGGEIPEYSKVPKYMGKTLDKLPIFTAGSINNSLEPQPIPLLSVANCSVQIYRKEADLSNSEYLSCNPTLCLVGASNDEDVPNVVGSSVMIVLPDPAARIFYTVTDTAALTHVKGHIDSLYEEAIRHGVAILDSRKGVEAAEALRIRQSTQSASIYSVYLSVINSIKSALKTACEWGGYDAEQVVVDAPSALTHGVPDSGIIREVIAGFGNGVVPISVIHRYMVGNGLLDQKISLTEYIEEIEKYRHFLESTTLHSRKAYGLNDDNQDSDVDSDVDPDKKANRDLINEQKQKKNAAEGKIPKGDSSEKDNIVK